MLPERDFQLGSHPFEAREPVVLLGQIVMLASFQVVGFPVDEHDDIGVLLDRPAPAEIGQARALFLAPLHRPVELAQADDCTLQFLCQLLQGRRDLLGFRRLATLVAVGSPDEIQVIDADDLETLALGLEALGILQGLRPDVCDGLPGPVADHQRHGGELPGRLGDRCEAVFKPGPCGGRSADLPVLDAPVTRPCKVAQGDFRQFSPRHFQREKHDAMALQRSAEQPAETSRCLAHAGPARDDIEPSAAPTTDDAGELMASGKGKILDRPAGGISLRQIIEHLASCLPDVLATLVFCKVGLGQALHLGCDGLRGSGIGLFHRVVEIHLEAVVPDLPGPTFYPDAGARHRDVARHHR